MKSFLKNNKVWTIKKNYINKLSSKKNKILWLEIILLFLIITVFNIYFNFYKNNLLSIIFMILTLPLFFFLLKKTNEWDKYLNYLLEARLELIKVIWPSYKETINSTITVLAIIILTTIIIYIIELILRMIMTFILT